MRRYFFDIDDGTGLLADLEGVECDGLDDVRFKAIDVLPDVAREELPDGDDHRFLVRVRDAGGRPVLVATLTLETRWLDVAGMPASDGRAAARRRQDKDGNGGLAPRQGDA